jgi:hypothetical protein
MERVRKHSRPLLNTTAPRLQETRAVVVEPVVANDHVSGDDICGRYGINAQPAVVVHCLPQGWVPPQLTSHANNETTRV